MIHLTEASFFSPDLSCRVCVRRALDGLRALDGVVAVRVSSALCEDDCSTSGVGVATVKFHPGFVSLDQLRRLLEDTLGFVVSEVRIEEHPVQPPRA
jgi:copper chaperone CopZ